MKVNPSKNGGNYEKVWWIFNPVYVCSGMSFAVGGYAVLCGGDLYKDVHRKFVRPAYRVIGRATRQNQNWQSWTYHSSW